MNMTKVYSYGGYDFYVGSKAGYSGIYNIVKTELPTPTGGYLNRRYIERIRGMKFPDRYQPTLHGTRETYLSDVWSEYMD